MGIKTMPQINPPDSESDNFQPESSEQPEHTPRVVCVLFHMNTPLSTVSQGKGQFTLNKPNLLKYKKTDKYAVRPCRVPGRIPCTKKMGSCRKWPPPGFPIGNRYVDDGSPISLEAFHGFKHFFDIKLCILFFPIKGTFMYAFYPCTS
jgi:hypothetical protein